MHDGVVYQRARTAEIWWIRYRDRKGVAPKRVKHKPLIGRKQIKRLRERLQARDANLFEVFRKGESLAYEQWADFFLENLFQAACACCEDTQAKTKTCIKHLKAAFGMSRLVDITADHIEIYLRDRLRQRVRIKSSLGFREKGVLQPATDTPEEASRPQARVERCREEEIAPR